MEPRTRHKSKPAEICLQSFLSRRWAYVTEWPPGEMKQRHVLLRVKDCGMLRKKRTGLPRSGDRAVPVTRFLGFSQEFIRLS
jgi:hypothetical protein